MDAKELFQKQVLKDIKIIAEELTRIQSFSGLLAHQQKIQSLYEKFIFLKQLHSSKYQQFLDNPVLAETIKETSSREAEQRDFYDAPKPEVLEEVIKPEEKENQEEIIEKWKEKEEVTHELEKEEKQEQGKEIKEHLAEQEEVGFKPLGIDIAEIKPIEKVKKLNPIKLDFNDSIAFISQLFNGSKADMDEEFKILNETNTLDEAKKWIENMFHKYNWSNKQEYVERLSGLIVHRFES